MASLFVTPTLPKILNPTTAPEEESALTIHIDSPRCDTHKRVVNFWCDSDTLVEEISENRLRPS
jgi:hypothetical protein